MLQRQRKEERWRLTRKGRLADVVPFRGYAYQHNQFADISCRIEWVLWQPYCEESQPADRLHLPTVGDSYVGDSTAVDVINRGLNWPYIQSIKQLFNPDSAAITSLPLNLRPFTSQESRRRRSIWYIH